VVVTVAVGLAVGVTIATATGFGFGFEDSGGDEGEGAGGGLPPATTQVTRQTLVDSQTADGTLGYGPTRSPACTQRSAPRAWPPPKPSPRRNRA
jgi:hypothetical protein